MLAGYVRRREIEHQQALSLAWHVEALARTKELPPLDRLLGRSAPAAEAQSEDDMLAAMRAWVAATKGAEEWPEP